MNPPVRPIRGLAIFAVLAIIADSLVGIVAAVIDVQRAALIDRLVDDYDAVPVNEVDASDTLYALSGMLELGVYLLAIVAFLIWLFRARANAEALAPVPHRHRKPWLIFGWAVPIIALWYPKQIVDDIWNASQPENLDMRRRSGLIWAWWLAWLSASWIANVTARVLFRADDLETMARAARYDVLSIGLFVVTAVLVVPVILKITGFQEARRVGVVPSPLSANDGSQAGAVLGDAHPAELSETPDADN